MEQSLAVERPASSEPDLRQRTGPIALARVRCLIVDDESLARKKLRALIESEPDFLVLGECCNGSQAVQAIRELAPDLVFLDVQMPGGDAFRVVEEIDTARKPLVVFVTAHEEYAVRAYEVPAFDYLLKPVDRDRLRISLSRVRSELKRSSPTDLDERVDDLLRELRRLRAYPRRIAIRSIGQTDFLEVDFIDWIGAEGDCLHVHARGATHLLRQRLSELERRLDPTRFCRIHRSTIVNIDRVRTIQPVDSGAHTVLLEDGTRLTLSRTYRDRLRVLIDGVRFDEEDRGSV